MVFRLIQAALRACMVTLGLVAILNITPAAIAAPGPAPADLPQAVAEIESLDAMRSGLASTLEGQTEMPTGETFKQVCKPVGMRAKQLSQERGWQVKQIANRYRNPAHAPDNLHARMALAKFEQDPDLVGFWDQETMGDQTGVRYYRRINVEATCLACHGAKGDRPDFVKAKYPDDRAYDFNVGDLRGMYAVFVPATTQADVQAALQ
ncbi:MAG: DUF3365 domain-containing protein [Leptolyngbya sp.]|nr:DUF3365 domain-containing protein [Leptolyngbya sp.]